MPLAWERELGKENQRFMDGSYGGGPSCSSTAQEQISCFFGEQVPLPFSSSSAGCRERSGFPRTEKLELEVEVMANGAFFPEMVFGGFC